MPRTAILFCLLAAGCRESVSQAPPEPPTPAGPPIDYASWPALTPEPVRVPEHLLRLCVRPPEAERRGPHFAPAVKYYANPEAFAAVAAATGTVPVGTTVVKEKFWTDGGPATAVAAMVKREVGYDPGF